MEKLHKRLSTNFVSYHGCGIFRLDGSNVLITKNFPCLSPIKNCFWMKVEDAVNIIRTRSRTHKNFYLKSLSIPAKAISKIALYKLYFKKKLLKNDRKNGKASKKIR